MEEVPIHDDPPAHKGEEAAGDVSCIHLLHITFLGHMIIKPHVHINYLHRWLMDPISPRTVELLRFEAHYAACSWS